jgi:hypothetical protein
MQNIVDNIENSESERTPKLHRMQAIQGERAFVLCIPKDFITELKISKGDYVKCWIKDNHLIIKKANL